MATLLRSRHWGGIWFALPVLTAVWLHWGAVVAQEAKPLPNKQLEASALSKAEKPAFDAMFLDGQVPATGQALIDKQVAFVISEITSPIVADSSPNGIVRVRQEWKRKLSTANAPSVPNATLHKALNMTTLAKASEAALDAEVSPAARVNLVLLFGMLDRVEKQGPTPPIALPEGTLKLIEFLRNNQLPAYLHSATIEQLVRHAELETTGPQRKAIVEVITPYLSGKAPANYDPQGWNWLRKRSANILQSFAEKGFAEANEPTLIAGLIDMLLDDRLSVTTRCDAAAAVAAYDGRVLGGTNRAKDLFLGIAETSLAMLRESQDATKSLPLVVSVQYALSDLAEALKPADSARTKGLFSATTDQSLKSTISLLQSKLVTCNDQLAKKLPKGKTKDEIQQIKVTEEFAGPISVTAGEVEAIVKPLRTNPVAAVDPKQPAK